MKSSNPVLGKAFNQPTTSRFDQLEQSYNAPAASSMRTGRMTIEDVVAKTGFLFAILVVVGALAWSMNLGALECKPRNGRSLARLPWRICISDGY